MPLRASPISRRRQERLAEGELAAFPPGQRRVEVARVAAVSCGGQRPAVGGGLGRARGRVRPDRERRVADRQTRPSAIAGHRDVEDDLHERLGHPVTTSAMGGASHSAASARIAA